MKNKIAALALATTLVLPGLTPAFAAEAKADDIVVEKNGTYLTKGTYTRAQLEAIRTQLQEAVSANETMVGSAQFIIDNVPETVKRVRAKLDQQLEISKKAAAEAKAFIAEIDALLK